MSSATLVAPSSLPAVELDSETLYEIVNGERREIPHLGAWAGTIASMLIFHLNAFAMPRKLGPAMGEVLFRLSPLQARRPDVAFLAYDRWPITTVPTDDPPEWPVAPNLAVEVVSPSNTADAILDKIQESFDAGVQLVWVIFPRQRRIYVYESPEKNHILTERNDLEGGEVLPGFRLNVAALFASAVKP